MSESARRELARVQRSSSIVARTRPVVWALDWVEARFESERGWRLGIWFSCSAPQTVPPALAVDDFSLETVSGVAAPGWALSELKLESSHATLLLSRSASAGPWTDARLLIVYRGPLQDDGTSVDPLRDRREIVFSEPVAALSEEFPAQLAGDRGVGDYATTRQGLLARLAVTAPEWQERSEADPWMVLVDLLAWAGDRLAAYQDAVATEAWLVTARRRLSVRRHARLLDFVAHEGCSSRAWLHIEPQSAVRVSEGFCFASKPHAEPGEPGARFFHALAPCALSPQLEHLPLYRWGAPRWTLFAGTRQLALEGSAPGLEPGAALLFPGSHVARVAQLQHEQDPLTGKSITRIELFAEDALPADLELTGQTVSANLVLVGEGARFEWGEPPEVGVDGRLRFALRGRRLARAPCFNRESAQRAAASAALKPDPEQALLDVTLTEHRPGGRVLHWQVRQDLMESGPYDRHVVAELDDDVLQLRFGDGIQGRPAPSAALLRARARCAGAPHQMATAGTRLYPLDDPQLPGTVRVVRESGGVNSLPSSEVRLRAPALSKVPEVCRQGSDYARFAREVPGVLDAESEIQWSGSWYTARVWILPQASDVIGADLLAAVRARLESVRQLGVDLELSGPRYVVGEIALQVRVAPHVPASSVERALRARLGSAGLFARSAYRLGTSLSSGALVAAAGSVPGVSEVRLRRFRRADDPDDGVRDWIAIGRCEVLRVGTAGAEPVELDVKAS